MKGQVSNKLTSGTVKRSHDDIAASKITSSNEPSSWSNPRKRPHNHNSGGLFDPISNDDFLQESCNGEELHTSKRGRTAEWPLKNSTDVGITTSSSRFSKTEEYNKKRSSSSSVRPSRFQEGSMNDRVSQKPPSLYTREEQAMEQWARNQSQSHDETVGEYDAGIATNKPSGVFRFGKAIASAFRPFTAWPGIWKDKEKERSVSPEKNIMQERQAKALEAFADLKKSGYRGTQGYTCHDNLSSAPANDGPSKKQQEPSFRDSGIDMNDGRQLYEPNPNDQLVGFTEALLVPPPPPRHRSVSPFTNSDSARKPSLTIRKPSLQGLKKATSQIHLSPTKRQADISAIPSPNAEPPSASTQKPVIQKMPSKKDITKQDRLSKKVSDLENKLETARRELELSMTNAPPVPDLPSHLGRKPFKPGALPTLPSERNMSSQKDDLTRSTSNEENIPPPDGRTAATLPHADTIHKPSSSLPDFKNLKKARSSNRMRNPSKSYDTKTQTPSGVNKRLPKVPSKTPHNSPSQPKEKVPPIPAPIEKVKDTKKITHSKATNHSSVSHLARAPSPFLGPPVSASPMRTRSKSSKRGISPPPPSLASAKKAKPAVGVSGTPMEGIEPAEGKRVDVDPIKPQVPQNKALPRNARGLPAAGKEDFEWDDDVF